MKSTTTAPVEDVMDNKNDTSLEEEEEDMEEDDDEDDEETEEKLMPQADYMHFIQTRLKGPEETFYKRAMQFTDNDTFVFDLNLRTQVYNKQPSLSVYGFNESISLLVTAVRALTLKEGENRAPLGVVGLEMVYDKFARLVNVSSSGKCTGRNMRCFLLDEHGYVVYASHENNTYYQCMTQIPRAGCHRQQISAYDRRFYCRLGQFFGDLCAAEHYVMDGLIKKEVYQKVTYVDYQALCSKTSGDGKGNFASRLLNPFFSLIKMIEWAWKEVIVLMAEYSIWSLLSGAIGPVKAYTETFNDANEGLPCDKASYFYLLNKEKAAELEGGALTATVCSSGCKIWPQVALVPGTNLLLVALEMQSFIDCETAQCNKDNEATKQVQFGFVEVSNASDKMGRDRNKCKSELRHRRAPGTCQWINETSYNIRHCSGTDRSVECPSLLLIGSFILSLISKTVWGGAS